MKIPVNHVIDSGAWFKYYGEKISCGRYWGPVDYRFRVLSFGRINLNDIDEPDKLDMREYNLLGGDFWIMKVEIVNLTKVKLYTGYLTQVIVVLDQDGYEYFHVNDMHLTLNSVYSKKTGLYAFHADLTPKIKYTGAIAYFLPKEEGAEYFLSVNSLIGGNIQEV